MKSYMLSIFFNNNSATAFCREDTNKTIAKSFPVIFGQVTEGILELKLKYGAVHEVIGHFNRQK